MATPLLSRSELGLRAPRSQPSNIRPLHLTAHYAGADPARWPWDHSRCPVFWRGYQAFHMDDKGWVDIGYSSGVCPHGWRFEGRGPRVRTAANGTNHGNDISYATVYIGGPNTPVTDAAKRAFHDEAARFRVPLNRWHSYWKPTDCPGDLIGDWVRAGAPLSSGIIIVEGELTMSQFNELKKMIEAQNDVLRAMSDKIDHINDIWQYENRRSIKNIATALGLKLGPDTQGSNRNKREIVLPGQKVRLSELTEI